MLPPPRLSICIPTFERPRSLSNCLNSILIATKQSTLEIEICISDNSASRESEAVAMQFADELPIRYSRNEKNLGFAGNFVRSVQLARGEFVWLVGDDDLLLPNSLENFASLQNLNPEVDFFFINAYELDCNFLKGQSHPFDTRLLPQSMKLFSEYRYSHQLPFHELIDYKKSFDFLGGMFLSIFRRDYWLEKADCLNYKDSDSTIVFSSLDTTFPHSKVFANAFMGRKAYFNADPLVVAVSGLRTWSEFYPIVRSFRLINLLDEYRKNGLGYLQYYKNKNASLKFLAYDLAYYFFKRDFRYPRILIRSHIYLFFTYPNATLSIARAIVGRIRKLVITLIA